MNREQIEAVLARYEPSSLPLGTRRPAAVLVPLRPTDDAASEHEVILTRRATGLGVHSGQVSFPGGHIDPGDASAPHAALREAEEELGIAPRDVQLIGRLDDVITGTGFHITPVVGFLPWAVTFRPDPREVARVFGVPLARLCEPDLWQQQAYVHGQEVLYTWRFAWLGEDVWGATAHMLRRFVALLVL